MQQIGFLGFGEAAQAFLSGWRSDEVSIKNLGKIATFDVKVDDDAHRAALQDTCRKLDVECAARPEEAFRNKAVVFSLVTADRALEAATSVASSLGSGVLYLDCNSCSPKTKAAAATVVEAAGGLYVDVAVMAPVYPARHRTALLLSGAAADAALRILGTLHMNATVAGDAVGQASSIKMLRSVMIKGFEALTAEFLLAARRAGVEKAVIASLQSSDPGIDWTKRASYNLERMMAHGRRRSAEMTEVAATLRELGLPDRMAVATAEWQRQIGELQVSSEDNSLEARADVILHSFFD
ncbi:DUF1932 domain-containing protein [Rhizobium leguminosarum]